MNANREKLARLVQDDLKRANGYYADKIEPLLLRRLETYQGDKNHYEKKYPKLSEQTDFCSYDFYAWVEWAKSQILGAITGSNSVIEIIGCGPEDEKAASTMDALINWQITQQCHGYLVYDQWIREALIFELGILKCWWNRAVGTEHRREKMPMQAVQTLQTAGIQVTSVGQPDFWGDVVVEYEQPVVTQNRPELDHVSPFDLRWLPEARSLEAANFVAQRKIMTGSELLKAAGEGKYDKAACRAAVEKSGGVSWTTADTSLNPDIESASSDGEDNGRQLVEVYECYVKHDETGKGDVKDLIVTVCGDELLSVQDNTLGRLPFFTLSVHRDPYKVMPDLSMASIEGELQTLRTLITRQMLVNISMNNRPVRFVNAREVNVDDLLNNSEVIRCNADPAGVIVPQNIQPIAGWTMGMLEQLKQQEEEWTGRTRYNQGMDASSLNKTATGISAIMQASAQRINGIIKTFSETGLNELMRFLIKLNQTFIDQQQVIRVLNRPMIVQPDDLSGELDIIVNSDVGLGDKARQIDALKMYLTGLFPQALQLGVVTLEQGARAGIKLLELSGLKNGEQYIKPPEQIQQEQAQAQAMAQAQADAQADAQMQALTQAGGMPVEQPS